MKANIEIDIHPHHALLFDESNNNWDPQPEYNYAFLRATASFLQHKFNARGFLFVNDVREALGFELTPSGQVCGWIRRDGYITIDTLEGIHGFGNIWITFQDQGVIVNNI